MIVSLLGMMVCLVAAARIVRDEIWLRNDDLLDLHFRVDSIVENTPILGLRMPPTNK